VQLTGWKQIRSASLLGSAAALGWAGALGAANADEIPAPAIGHPVDRAIDLQGAATAVSEEIHDFHRFLLWIITLTTLFVLALLLWVMVRYNSKANPVPKKFSHNTTIEIVWTVIPVLILVAIAIKSFPLLAKEEIPPQAELTIKAIGNKWYWSYEYPDLGISFDANVLKADEAAKEGKPYLLATDEAVVVPTGTIVKVLIVSNDVIHSWAMPSFGVKQDAIPGRVNQGWFNVKEPGVYYGQCSELCGLRHAFMPIEIHAVTKEQFKAWVASKGGSAAASAPATTEPAPTTPAKPS
jgi:cytochrome c oxidase subunit 2